MALGALTSVSADSFSGPQFIDRVSMPGDAAYPTSGTAGLQAALRVLRGDQRTIVSVRVYNATNLGYQLRFNPATGLLLALFEDQTSGVVAQVANATDISAVTFLLEIVSK